MCGIVGFTGNRQAAPILLDGLSKLEYRGYDSAGLAVRDGENLAQVVKAKGRLSNLIEKTDGGKALKGTCGIGHTRWATHGEPSQTNAHPHVSGNCTRSGSGTVESEVVGVHNGIIENYTELKEKLLKHGYTFYSQTDTEVVIKLVDYYYEENTTIMPPEKQIVQDDRDARAEELESAFSYDGYQVVRKELFAHLRDPAIVIRKDSITFNTACITGLEDVVYVHVMFNNDLKRIVVRGCDENDKDALRWCVAKPDKRKSRKMSCKPFATLVYQKMGWDSECRYKMLGYRITFEGETLYVFDLLVPEIFHEGQRKKNAVDSQDNAASTKPVNSRKGFYLDDIVGTFGVPVEEHRKESEVKQMDGYVSMGILTGKIAPEAGKD